MQPILHTGYGYIVTISDDTDKYIADSIHVEADPNNPVYTDHEAAQAAEADGVELIYGMEDVPDGVYVDLPGNREAILRSLAFFPGYRFMYHYQNEHNMEEN